MDLDGTLAHYDEWRGVAHIGEPIPAMVERVKRWIAEGRDVRIFTARVTSAPDRDLAPVVKVIRRWCKRHIGKHLPITNVKDFAMIELWDDRAVTVEENTGRALSWSRRGLM